MTLNEARKQLMELQAKLSAYHHATGVLHFDGMTTAPRGTAKNRAHSATILSGELYKLNTSPETRGLLAFLEEHQDELDRKERRMVHLLLKNLRKTEKIPMDFYMAHRKMLIESSDVWHKAKEANDFAMFEPYLQRVFEDCVKLAEICDPGTDPFDYWLNDSEEGLNSEKCDAFFDAVKKTVVPLAKAISERPQVDDSILHGYFPEYKQRRLSSVIMDIMGIDKNRCGIATTEHPFTTSLGSQNDVRITTHYYEDNFAPAMFSVMHEGGHGLYFMYPNEEFAYTALDGGASMSLHESQSRFYENYIGRSRGFIKTIFPKLAEIFPENFAGRTPEDLYLAVNKVSPGLSRIRADEVTYTLHILVRYELERRLLAGEVKVHDAPEAWNALYKDYLGIDVPSYTEGILQDSHWGDGLVGYFPTYSLGTAYSAQFLKKMKETVDVDKLLDEGDLAPISAWNREHIWQYGMLYEPEELLTKVFGGPFDPTVFTEYLEKKYKDIYKL